MKTSNTEKMALGLAIAGVLAGVGAALAGVGKTNRAASPNRESNPARPQKLTGTLAGVVPKKGCGCGR